MIRKCGAVGVLTLALMGAGCTINVDAEPSAPSSTTLERASVTTTRLMTTTRSGAASDDFAYLGMLDRVGGFDMSSTNRETLVGMGWAVCEAVDSAVHKGEDAATFMGYMTEPMSRAQAAQFVKAVTAATLYLCPWNEDWD